jgi:hypothetical protein
VAKEAALYPPDTVGLLVLALYHQGRAERSQHPAEQCEHQRVADIYEVLATMDLPMSAFAAIERSSQNPANNDAGVPGAVEQCRMTPQPASAEALRVDASFPPASR